MPQPHWPAVTEETIRHLRALLQIDTTNPPGNELRAAEYLAGVLRAEGLAPLVLESTPGRGNLVVRLKGAGQAAPLLLYAHTDVVTAEPQHWMHPPFAAEVADGCVWGRGAIDMKNTVAQYLMALLLLKREGVALKRDVIFAATADEEIGGADGYGISWLVKHHPDLLRAEFGLSEVGGYNMEIDGRQIYPIQVAEKGTAWFKLRARGRPGHGSMPHNDNAVAHLARAVNALATRGLPYHLCAASAGYLNAMADALGGEFGAVLRGLQTEAEAARLFATTLTGHERAPMLNAILHNTATPTMLQAGAKTNVIPSTAEATIDGRTLPGFDWEMFLDEVQAVVGGGFEFEPIIISPPIETSLDTPLYRLMAEALKRHDPAAAPVPQIMSGATDAKYLAPLGVPTYGFAPVKLPAGFPFMELFHAHDERVPIEGLGWGTRVLYEVVRDYCAR
jgi:acetylornithine deacetylase/succinyl-diaminopimelate desuccinylase-like protein